MNRGAIFDRPPGGGKAWRSPRSRARSVTGINLPPTFPPFPRSRRKKIYFRAFPLLRNGLWPCFTLTWPATHWAGMVYKPALKICPADPFPFLRNEIGLASAGRKARNELLVRTAPILSEGSRSPGKKHGEIKATSPRPSPPFGMAEREKTRPSFGFWRFGKIRQSGRP
jgi:hypothetical protein